ncbi:MAG TPA: cytidylate kinase-like family protein [Isosphaeraceae bacterium]|nr:cytidylate kinase-like family protein [Isosphaeraceae bacterium]
MRLITVSREYGAGGAEVAKRLAEDTGWTLLDRELMHQAAAIEHVPDSELESLDEQEIRVADRFRLHPPHNRYIHGLKEVVDQAVAQGNVILVGRGTNQLVGNREDAFHLRLVAPRAWRAQRMADFEGWTPEQALARCTEVDRTRDRFNRYFFGDGATRSVHYDLVVNAGRVSLDDVVATVAELARDQRPADEADRSVGHRTLTLTGELGAGDSGLAPTLAERLRLKLFDRELLEQEASRLGVSLAELERVDEQPAGIFQRFRPGSLHQRYFETLGQLIRELAAQGDKLLVGRGGCRFLEDDPRAFHVRLVADLSVRLRRVMEHRWLAEEAARSLLEQTDNRRRQFYETFFGADWTSPLGYHLTVNTGRLGPKAVDLIVSVTERNCARTSRS